jgi:hypothetical protein
LSQKFNTALTPLASLERAGRDFLIEQDRLPLQALVLPIQPR